ncbi:hypothetical protein ABIA35_008113 [Catenulispora sp. MAP12-49]|uniref:hypothetical protein n=1 Tax=Catenulispora sp. MAP12-49 TaxID=3156302 RepID=UPI00351302F8
MAAPSIEMVTEVDAELVDVFNRPISQLTPAFRPLDRYALSQAVGAPANTVLAARLGDRIAGVLTLVIMALPTGNTARIEDVVVDEARAARGWAWRC